MYIFDMLFMLFVWCDSVYAVGEDYINGVKHENVAV